MAADWNRACLRCRRLTCLSPRPVQVKREWMASVFKPTHKAGCGAALKEHLLRVLKLRGRTISEIVTVVTEFAKNVAPDAENGDAYRAHLQEIIKALADS
jgi:hypothetical protein